jgi:hypothetical protein
MSSGPLQGQFRPFSPRSSPKLDSRLFFWLDDTLEEAMNKSSLNDYLQTAAAVGALIALLAVGYEIRQSNRIALQEATSANWTNWINFMGYKMESGISATLAKSMQNPEELSLTEKIDLDAYLQQFTYVYHHDYAVLGWGDAKLAESILVDLQNEAGDIFGSRFSRAWFQENRNWMFPEIAEVIQQEIDENPLGSDMDYYERIDALTVTLK